MRNFYKSALLLLFLITGICYLNAQQLPIYSQYTFNKFLLNPAIAGSDGYTTISLVAREQWVGFKGTPKTHAFTMDSRLLRNSFISKNASVRRKRRLSSRSGRVGWAAHVFNDHNGPLDRTGVEGTYSYHIAIDQGQLSFGLSGLFYQFRLNKDKVDLGDNMTDPLIEGMRGTLYIPDANFGLYYTSASVYGGVSVMQIFQSSIHFGDDNDSDYRLKRNYNLLGGYYYNLSRNVAIEPSFLLKIPTASRPQLDINTKLYYKDNYWAGLAWRTRNAMVVYFGARFDKYFVGYGFDYNFSPIGKRTLGTHEFMAAVKFGDTARRYRWLNTY
ncbi:MAG TPA: type IX secretion system membrane protein PorP/SprF [Bacteroidales bacterium]|nr:type IX secretion system membrane protein PorP/SprF [Bacteroidales bacterium]